MHGVTLAGVILHAEPQRKIACKQAGWCISWKAPKSVWHMTPTGVLTGVLQELLANGAKQKQAAQGAGGKLCLAHAIHHPKLSWVTHHNLRV